MLELPTVLWKEYKFPICMIAAIVGVLYLSSLRDAAMNPWTLWRQEWRQESRADQSRIASYEAQKVCVENQWKKLKEQLELKEQANALIANKTPRILNFRSVSIQEGTTIFEFKKSAIFETKTSLPAQIQTEIVATISFFCAPTSSLYGLWPYYTPSSSAASDNLKRFGEKALAIQANQLSGE